MNYSGKLYGRIANKYFDTGKTSDDWDNLERKIAKLEKEKQTNSESEFKQSFIKDWAWSLRTPKNYSENSGCFEVVWEGIFMPFDVICGLDGCPPDNEDYTKYKKTHWWVCPKTKQDVSNVHNISMFMKLPNIKEFKKLEDAINYCLDWRKEWLQKEMSKVYR